MRSSPRYLTTGLTAALLLSCQGDHLAAPGTVTLGMTTDMVIDDDIATVGLYVRQLDGTRVLNTWGWRQDAKCDDSGVCQIKFPATFVIESGARDSRVHARIIGFDHAQNPIVMREARFRVATEGATALRLPLLWVNSGVVQDHGAGRDIAAGEDGALPFDPFVRFRDDCPAEQTRDDRGECVSIDSDAALETLDPLVGLPDPKAPCLDPVACFSDGERRFRTSGLQDEANGCSLEVPAAIAADRVNVAVVVPDEVPGYLVDGMRIRPLAAGSAVVACAGDRCSGATGAGAENVLFPPAVCRKLRDVAGPDPSFLISTRCASRDVRTPLCASWNLSVGTLPADPPRPAPTNTSSSWFEVADLRGTLSSFSTQGADLLLGSSEADAVRVHRFAAPPFGQPARAADLVYDTPIGSTAELLRVSSSRPNLGSNGAHEGYSEGYVVTAPDRIAYLPPAGGAPVPVRLAIDCTDPNSRWIPAFGNAKIRAISMARVDATSRDIAARLRQIAEAGDVSALITPETLGSMALAIVSFERDDSGRPGQTEWMNTVGVAGSALLSGQLRFGSAANVKYSSPDPTCIQLFPTTRHDGDPGTDRCVGIDSSTCCQTGPCAGVFDGSGGPLGVSTEVAPNELGNFIAFDREFAAAEAEKDFRWCGMEDAQFLIDTIGQAVIGGGSLDNLPPTPISCFSEYFDYDKGPLWVGSMAIGGGFRSPDEVDQRRLFTLLDPTSSKRRLTLFETSESLFLEDANGEYVRSELGNRQHRERSWRELEGRVFAKPERGTRIVSFSADGGATNVACYVAETPTVACYDQDGKPVALPIDTGFVSRIFLDDTNLRDDEANLYVAVQCTAAAQPDPARKDGRVFVYRLPWSSLTTGQETLPNPCRPSSP